MTDDATTAVEQRQSTAPGVAVHCTGLGVSLNGATVTTMTEAGATILQKEKRLSNAWSEIYKEAVLSVEEGGNLARLAKALVAIGWTKSEAAELALYVHNRATALITRNRYLELGIREAVWLYSGAGCLAYRNDTHRQIQIDAAHKAANGQKYLVAKGMKIGGRYTWPGMDRHCKCGSKSVVLGLS